MTTLFIIGYILIGIFIGSALTRLGNNDDGFPVLLSMFWPVTICALFVFGLILIVIRLGELTAEIIGELFGL